MKFEFSRQIFEKSLTINIHLNLSGGSRVVPCGRTDGQMIRQTDGLTMLDGQTDMTKLIVAFRNFANVLKKLIIGWRKIVKNGDFLEEDSEGGQSYT